MYFLGGPGLLSVSSASVSSVRRTHRASKPPAHVAAARERLAEKNTGVRPLSGAGLRLLERKSPSPHIWTYSVSRRRTSTACRLLHWKLPGSSHL